MNTLSDILPHVLLPIVLVAGHFLPPFRGRAAVFAVALAIAQWRCTFSSWPPNVGDARAMRYGLATSWIFTLPTLERLVLHVPERDFWRVDDDGDEDDDMNCGGGGIMKRKEEEEEAGSRSESSISPPATTTTTTTTNIDTNNAKIQERQRHQQQKKQKQKQNTKSFHNPTTAQSRRGNPIPEYSPQKLAFALRLVATPRAVGWNVGSRAVNAERAKLRAARKDGTLTRGGFVMQRVALSVVCGLVWDAIMVTWQRLASDTDTIPERWAWDGPTAGRIAFAEVLMLGTVYCGMNMQYASASALAVGLFGGEIEEWPPLFGNILDCYTIANVWGRFWHQYIRQPSLGISHFLLQHLHIPRHSPAAYTIHLTTAFLISAACHILAVGTVSPGFYPLRSLIHDMLTFFMLQPLGTLIESTAIVLFKRYMCDLSIPPRNRGRMSEIHDVGAVDGKEEKEKEDARNLLAGLPNSKGEELQGLATGLCRLAGYLWVVLWFHVTAWPFIRAYAGVGMQGWQIPFSVVGRVVALFGW